VSRIYRRSLINIVGFQVGWFLCVAFFERPLIGILTTAVILALHAALVLEDRREWLLMLLVIAAGSLIDSLLGIIGVLVYPESGMRWLLPLWLFLLWILFSTLIQHSLRWLQTRLWLAAILAGLSAPSSYWLGARLTDTGLGWGAVGSLLVIGIYWALLLPGFLRLARRYLHD
jgi:hypothetical protein